MAKTMTKTIVNGVRKVKDTYKVKTKIYFKIFEVTSKVLIKTECLGNDIAIDTDQPINNVYLNGKKLKEKRGK